MNEKLARARRRMTLPNIESTPGRFKRPPDYYVLWVFVVLLLAFNLALLWFLFIARQRVTVALQEVETYRQTIETRLGQAGTVLANLKSGTLEYTASIDQTIPFSATIPLDYEMEVPVNMTIPINTSVTVPIQVPIPGVDSFSITIPISANIPVNTTFKVPVNMSVLVDTSVPIKLDIPVSIKISDTFLAASLDEIQALLDQLSLDLGGFSLDSLKLP
jgi:hypothetical protein